MWGDLRRYGEIAHLAVGEPGSEEILMASCDAARRALERALASARALPSPRSSSSWACMAMETEGEREDADAEILSVASAWRAWRPSGCRGERP